MVRISIGSKKMVSRYWSDASEWHKGVAMKGVRFRFGYDRLSRDCSQSERDGCAQVQTATSMPLQVYNPIVGKGRQ
jgi:hypothetical protein